MTTVADFVTNAKALIGLVTDGIGLFMDPPLVYFVGFAALGAGIAMAKKLVPKKRG